MKSHPKHSTASASPVSPPPPAEGEAAAAVPIENPLEPTAVSEELPAADPTPAPEVPAPVAEEVRLREQLLRLQADFDNYRKRTAREQADWSRRTAERILIEFLAVLDSLERAEQQAREHAVGAAFRDGLNLVIQQFQEALRKQGVVPIESIGQVFDPLFHEAIAQMPSAEYPDGVIAVETRKGYRWEKEALRHAQVVVSSGPPPTAGSGEVSE